ncbi:MAG: S-methyl-5-thioribose-1-phosphate isomerase [Pirellulaceae bacterium]
MTDTTSKSGVETITWKGDTTGNVVLIDQTRLPLELVTLECREVETVWEAIKMLRVRGAPAIGIAAAYGVIVGIRDTGGDPAELAARFDEVTEYLATSRPTAVNLFWALTRMRETFQSVSGESNEAIRARLLAEAIAIHEEDRQMCRDIGRHGAELLGPAVSGVLTHCNAGGLATAEYGTALSVFFTAQDLGREIHVYVDETRPLLQGARLTAWELMQRNIPATLICDSMAAQVMREGRVQAVVTGADRIAANGDAANKIGTYSLAILARHHDIPFYIAAPSSTFDLSISSGQEIPIEQRQSEEITQGFGKQTAPDGVAVYNPAFDVTPASLITAIITERGVIDPVTTDEVASHLA